MSVISTGQTRKTPELAVTGALSAATLLLTGAAIFVSTILSHGTITAPSFVATSTGTGLTMQGGGDINASSTNSDLWVGGHATTTNLEFRNATGTNELLTGNFSAGSSTVTTLNFTNATGSSLYVSNWFRIKPVYTDLPILMSATRINPATSKPDLIAWSGAITVIGFDASSTETVNFQAQFPHSINHSYPIYPHFHYSPIGGGPGTAVFELSCVSSTVSGIFDTASTTSIGIFAASTTARTHMKADFATDTAMLLNTDSPVFDCALSRIGNNASDTYGDDVAVHSFDWHIAVDSLGSVNINGD
jgi:hypothetical protein